MAASISAASPDGGAAARGAFPTRKAATRPAEDEQHRKNLKVSKCSLNKRAGVPMRQRSARLSGADRKGAILAAAAPVVARLGRFGATTKVIAKAAGVSEALLYKHFPAKEALYEQLERHCIDASAVGASLLAEAEPSTATLVMGVAVLVQAVFPGIGAKQSHDDTKRLVTSSLLDDGRFAKAFLDRHVKPSIELLADCFRAARLAGDVEEGARAGNAELWFVHHLANTLHLISLPDEDAVDYGMSREDLTVAAVLFLLRGLGLKQSAIDRHYDPETLRTVILQMVQEQPCNRSSR